MRKVYYGLILMILLLSVILVRNRTLVSKDMEMSLGDTVIGDIDGDGKVKSSDLILIKKHLLEEKLLTGDEKSRAENLDGKNGIKSGDLLVLKKILLGETSTVAATGISLDKTTLSIEVGSSVTLTATVNPSNATDKSVTWKSSNTSIAKVDKNGKVTALKEGDVTITATSNNGSSTTCSVSIYSVYDVVLFWGQSNMVGSSQYDEYDTRLKKDDVCKSDDLNNYYKNDGSLCKKTFSKYSGINLDILNNYTAINHVDVNIPSKTVYVYNYSSNKLQELKGNENSIGEDIYAKLDKNNNLISFTNKKADILSIEKSDGTNIIPYFGKTYYEKTGHKLVVVFAALGGTRIQQFLPHNDADLANTDLSVGRKNRYIYELIIEKYQATIKYMKDHNMKIGKQFHVSFQGEGNNNYITDYDRIYKKVHNNFKSVLGLKFGVLIETSTSMPYRKNGEYVPSKNKNVLRLHDLQEKIISNNSDIILGSDYSFRYFVPNKTIYCDKLCSIENCNVSTCNKNLTDSDYIAAYKNSLLGRSFVISKLEEDPEKYDNSIHFTSAALSQIGYEAAINTSNYLKTK